MSYLSATARDRLLRGGGLLVLGFLWLPLIVMAVLSFGTSSYATFPMGELTLKWYEQAFADTDLLISIGNTLVVASISATLATVLGLLGAFALVRREFPFKPGFRLLSIVPMIIPGVVLGIALLILFNTVASQFLSLGTVIVAHALYVTPFALLTISAQLYGFDESMEEAGRDLGASRLTVLRTITIPQLAASIAAGGLLAFVRSFSEFIRAFFVNGGQPVFTIKVWTLLNHELTPKINAISTVVMVGLLVVLLAAHRLGSQSMTEHLYS